MSTFRDWEAYKRLKNRADTNSVVDVLKNKSTGDLIVRKIIYGIEQPLYQAVFTREMRALYKLNKCSNIVNILGDDYLVISTTKEKVGVIYLEYINGIELGKSSIENFSAKERFSIIKQLLDAIEISHSNGIIHRDINPNNIMLTDDKQVKLIDFGICKINDMINSATVYKLGTNAYSAPEVHQHSENATEKSDLYSLGAVIYFLFTGQQPPLAVQFQDVLNRTSGMDVSLKPILKKLVAENPDDRYENVFELRADFSKLFTRFLNLDKTIILTAAYERIKELRNLKLLPQSINIKMATETYMPENFLDLYAFCRKEESNENRKQVTIRKRNINELSVNMITGNIEESGKNAFAKPSKRDLCLSEEQTITKDYLESNYAIINEIYQQNQIESNIFNTKILQRELYKILDIAYEKLYYVKDELFIYKNDDSEDYEFIIKGDIGERYQNSFYHQVRDVVYSGMENFFERDWDFSKNHYDKGLVTQEDRQYTKSLIEKLNGSEIISDELVDQYIHTRALIDEKELEAIFSCNQEFDYQGIVISCERLKKLLNPEIVSALNAISKKRIWLLYDPKEYNVNKILEQNFGDKIKKKEVSVSENERISEQFICFYPNILVEYVEKTEKVFDRPITIFEGRIEFDSDVIKNKIDKIIDEYEISFSLSEPEPEKMGKNKYNKHTKKGIAHTYKKYKYKEKNK